MFTQYVIAGRGRKPAEGCIAEEAVRAELSHGARHKSFTEWRLWR